MQRHLLRLFILGLTTALCACSSIPHKPGTPDASSTVSPKKAKSPSRQTRDNAASLLHDLMGDEKNLSKVLIVKSASAETAQLVKSIAEAAADASKSLDAMSEADHRFELHRLSLPAGETAAREASGKTAQHDLLHSSGKDFEFQLLLTQVQALGYGSQLAKVAAANDTDPERSRRLSGIANQLENLYHLVTDRLRTIE